MELPGRKECAQERVGLDNFARRETPVLYKRDNWIFYVQKYRFLDKKYIALYLKSVKQR